MKKKLFVVVIVAAIILSGVAVVSIFAKDNLKIKPYYNKGELEDMLDEGRLASDFLLETVPKDLSPIDAGEFIFYVPSAKDYHLNTSYQVHTLSQFNDLFEIECIKRIGGNRIAVVYKLGLNDDFAFAVVVFECKEVNYSGSEIEPKVYDLWIYKGECYYYSAELTPFAENKLKKGMKFQELENAISGISKIFRVDYNEEANMWNWSTIVLTENGAKKIVFGLEKTTDIIERSAINDSTLIEVTAVDCK